MRDVNKYAENYTSGIIGTFELKLSKYRVAKLIELVNQYDHHHFLEIGCALWPFANFVDDYDKYTLVEPADKYVQNAKEVLQGKNCKIIQGFFEDHFETLKDENYDLILASGLLHEVENPKKFLETALNLCYKKTVLILTVPNAEGFHRLLAYESGLIPNVFELGETNINMQKHRVFDMKTLLDFIHDVADNLNKQIEILDKGSYFIKPFTHEQMQKCLDIGIFDEKILDGLNKMIKYMPELGAEIYVVLKLSAG